tara:strand:+ start:633 stop:968 length:336 start_codon:yes stop_codon:yes gene_type:complete
MELKGIILKIGDQKSFGKTNKVEIVLKTDFNSDYPQTILIEFLNKSIDQLQGYKEGDEATISINVKGRAWVNPEGQTKYFNSINGWKISKGLSQVTSSDQLPDRQDDLLDF